MNCPHCQRSIPDDAAFCHVCGTRISSLPGGTTGGVGRVLPPLENIELRNPLASIFRRYFDFKGRSSRRELWLTAAIWCGAYIVWLFFGSLIEYYEDRYKVDNYDFYISVVCAVFLFYTVSTLIPGIAALVRRMHDTGRKGWMLFLFFTGVCTAYVVYLLCQASQPGANEFGLEPRLEPKRGSGTVDGAAGPKRKRRFRAAFGGFGGRIAGGAVKIWKTSGNAVSFVRRAVAAGIASARNENRR